jgi:hypothetical protein
MGTFVTNTLDGSDVTEQWPQPTLSKLPIFSRIVLIVCTYSKHRSYYTATCSYYSTYGTTTVVTVAAIVLTVGSMGATTRDKNTVKTLLRLKASRQAIKVVAAITSYHSKPNDNISSSNRLKRFTKSICAKYLEIWRKSTENPQKFRDRGLIPRSDNYPRFKSRANIHSILTDFIIIKRTRK